MEQRTEVYELLQQLERITNKIKVFQSRPREYGTGEPIYYSELSMIKMIHKHPDSNITDLAARQGVTKGAISQTAAKLAERGYVRKFRYEDNKKEVFLKLTEKGETVYESAMALYAPVIAELAAVYQGSKKRARRFLTTVLDTVEERLDAEIQ